MKVVLKPKSSGMRIILLTAAAGAVAGALLAVAIYALLFETPPFVKQDSSWIGDFQSVNMFFSTVFVGSGVFLGLVGGIVFGAFRSSKLSKKDVS